MKKIVFDLTKTQPQLSHNTKFHGGGKYGIAVFRKLAEVAPERLIAYYNDDLYIHNDILQIIGSKKIPIYYSKDINIVTLAKKYDSIIYSPIFEKNYVQDPSIIVYTCIHDIRSLMLTSDKYMFSYNIETVFIDKLKKLFWKVWTPLFIKYKYKRSLQKYHYIFHCKQLRYVTASEYSKYSIISFFPHLNEKDIKVCYSPSTICKEDLSDIPERKEKYWLMVSGNRWLKNSIRAIKAFDFLFSRHKEIEGKVIITGLKSLSELNVKVKNKSRFICKGYVGERDLKSYYHYAYAFIYPTLSEGFGYPPLEAMYEGCPVICSAVASVPEICGDAVLYFNPYSVHEIAVKILQFENIKTRNDYSERGIIRQAFIEKRQENDLDNYCHYLLEEINTPKL